MVVSAQCFSTTMRQNHEPVRLFCNAVRNSVSIPLCVRFARDGIAAADAFADSDVAGIGGWWLPDDKEALLPVMLLGSPSCCQESPGHSGCAPLAPTPCKAASRPLKQLRNFACCC